MKIDFKSKVVRAWSFGVLIVASALAFCALPGPPRTIDFDLQGRVLDKNTMEPLEGAYVIAVYETTAASSTAVARYCIKTKGMFSGKDGRFRFPVEKLDNKSPSYVFAIKSGYFGNDGWLPTEKMAREQPAEAYSRRDVYLNKQDPAKPDFRIGQSELWCSRAKSRDDAEASIQFLKLEMDEFKRVGADERRLRALSEVLSDLERLPTKQNINK